MGRRRCGERLPLQGRPDVAIRAGVRGGVVDLQRALNLTHEGQEVRTRIKCELDVKQAELDRAQREIDKYGRNKAAFAPAPEYAALTARFAQLSKELIAHEQEATKSIVDRLKAEVAELARARQIDVVVEASLRERNVVVYRHWSRLVDGPNLTDELIRQHDARFPGS